MMAEEIRVLGVFRPSGWDPDTIEREFRALLPECCKRERVSIRIPAAFAEDPPAANMRWHQDGGGSFGTTKHMVVWASEMPTELRSSKGVCYTGAPFELVWFDNYLAYHRQPAGTRKDHRWFAAVRCSGEGSV